MKKILITLLFIGSTSTFALTPIQPQYGTHIEPIPQMHRGETVLERWGNQMQPYQEMNRQLHDRQQDLNQQNDRIYRGGRSHGWND